MADSLSWDLIVNDKSSRGIDSFTDNLEGSTSKVKSWAGKLAGVLAGAGAAAGAALTDGIAQNMELDQANDKLTGQLGLTADDAKKAGEVASKVYASGWGGSIDEVNDAISSINGTLGKVSVTSQADLQDMTTKALAFSSTFDQEVGPSAETAGKLIKNGLAKNATEAFDIMTYGFQNGANRSDDFLDTLNEYAPQFHKLGIDGVTATDVISQGLNNGARNSDILADAFKEFSLRAIDGSSSTKKAYKSLGLDVKGTAEDIAAGGDRAKTATDKVITAIQNVKDPVKKNQIAVALFGTQYEDLGAKAFDALDVIGDETTNVKGKTDAMAAAVGDNATSKVETMRRQFQMWTADITNSQGPIGTITAGIGAFGAGALTGATQLVTLGAAVKGTTIATTAASVATKVWAAGQWLLNAALTANPIGLVIVGIVALGAALVVAYKKSATFRAIVNGALHAVAGVAKAVGGTIRAVFVGAWNVVSGAARRFGSAARAVVHGVSTAVSTVARAVQTVFRTAWSTVAGVVKTSVGHIKTAIGNISKKASDVVTQIKGFFTLDTLAGAGRKLIQGLANGIKAVASVPVDAVRGIVNNIKGMLPGSPIKRGPLLSWNNGGAGKRLMGLLAKGITGGASTVVKAVSKTLTQVNGLGLGKKKATGPGATAARAVANVKDAFAEHGVKIGAKKKKVTSSKGSSGGGGGGGINLTVNIYGTQFGTPEQVTKAVVSAIRQAKANGMKIPFGTFQGGTV